MEADFGKIIGMDGDKATVNTILISLSMKLQQKSKVLFIDSANCFNPSFVQDNHRQSTKLMLDNISIARPFTALQMERLITKLKQNIPHDAKVLIISSIDELFYDNEIGDLEYVYIFKKMLIELEILTEKHDLATIISFSDKKDERREELLGVAMRKAAFWSKI